MFLYTGTQYTCTCRFSCKQMMFIYMYRVYIFILLFTLILQLPWRKLRSFKELSTPVVFSISLICWHLFETKNSLSNIFFSVYFWNSAYFIITGCWCLVSTVLLQSIIFVITFHFVMKFLFTREGIFVGSNTVIFC